jgi:hypothetical protein
MKGLRIFLAIPFILLFGFVLWISPLLTSAALQLTSPDYLPDALRESGIYEELPSVAWDFYQDSLDQADGDGTLNDYIPDEAPADSIDMQNPLEDLTYEEVADLYTKLELATFLDTEISSASSDLYAWLEGDVENLYIEIDATDKAQEIMEWVLAKSITVETDESLDVCTKADIEDIFATGQFEELDELPCQLNFATMDSDATEYFFTEVLSLAEAEGVDTSDMNVDEMTDPMGDMDFSNFKVEITQESLHLSPTDVTQIKEVYSYMQIAPIVIAVLVLIFMLVIFLLIPGKEAKYYVVGGVMTLASFTALSWGIVGGDMFEQFAMQAQWSTNTLSYEQTIIDLVNVLLTPIFEGSTLYAGIYLAVGIVLIIIGILVDRKNSPNVKPQSNTKKEDSEPEKPADVQEPVNPVAQENSK